MSSYMLWLNSSRERIKSENPGISITEISKKAGEMWKQIGKEDKEVRDGKCFLYSLFPLFCSSLPFFGLGILNKIIVPLVNCNSVFKPLFKKTV